MSCHLTCKTNNSYPIGRAIRKHGADKFSITLLSEHETEAEALEAEVEWIAYFKSIGARMYNATSGGEAPKFSAESRARMSAARKGRKRKPHTIQTKAKMSAASKGKPKSKEHCESLSKARKGKKSGPHSEQWKENIRAGNRARLHSVFEGKEFFFCKGCNKSLEACSENFYWRKKEQRWSTPCKQCHRAKQILRNT